MKDISNLENLRLQYKPKLSPILQEVASIIFEEKKVQSKNFDGEIGEIFSNIKKNSFLKPKVEKIIELHPLKVGVVFSGGQAPGGHNVISGLFDSLKLINHENKLFGFLNGPSGIIDNKYIEIDLDMIDKYRNRGGFDLLGSGRTKIETDDQFKASLETAKKLDLDGLVIIGGDDSNTNAALLAEYFIKNKIKTRVVGIPKTIDGDLKNEFLKTSFGFDTATKVYSELIGNISIDALSAKKYYHFIKLMGRSASHVTLECGIKTRPNIVLIAEEIKEKNKTLKNIVDEIADVIINRAEKDKNYGIVLIPEGLIEFIPEIKGLIIEINEILPNISNSFDENNFKEAVLEKISQENKNVFLALPEKIQNQLLLDRDPHGNVQVSKIETEFLIIEKVKEKLKNTSNFKGKFNFQTHFFGYEGRAGFPSNFDANFCYNLGFIASALIKENKTGYLCSIENLNESVDLWNPIAIPLTYLMNIEKRKGKKKPVIKKALVNIHSDFFKNFKALSKSWEIDDNYMNPGSVQYFGDEEITDSIPNIIK